MQFKMSDEDEYRCFIGGLAWSTSDRKLKDTFEKFGKLTEAKVTNIKLMFSVSYFMFVPRNLLCCTFGIHLDAKHYVLLILYFRR